MAPSVLFDEENQDHNHTIWHLSDGQDGDKGGWTRELDYLMDPQRLGGPATAPKPDPALYAPATRQTAKGDVETLYRDGRWKNQVEGNSRASNTSDTKAEAQAEGRRMAMDRGVTHVVRKKDGEIAETHDYSNRSGD